MRKVIDGVWADPEMPRVYSARAEAEADVVNFARLLRITLPSRCRIFIADRDSAMGDVLVEVHAERDVSYDTLLNTVRMVPDGHVLLQTLRPVPIGKNSLERNYERR